MSRLLARLAALGLVALSVAIPYFMLVAPALRFRDDMRLHDQDSAARLLRERDILADLPRLRTRLQRLRAAADADHAWLVAPNAAQAAAALQAAVKQAAAGTPVAMQSVQILPPTSVDGNVRIAVRITASLPSDALAGLLGRLEGSTTPLLTLENVDVQGADGGGIGFAIAAGRDQPVWLRADLVALQQHDP